ncbi:DUF4386 family protein [Permianibacter sp. IMCC34836]|uniref:DUF4386 family protein n=1 Tax=Permianibacter fluminis TaxID=2738515 RepID=UPI00155821B3|nr:DUF4386 family protein [Permianibacter fluminis]NQD37580.1 DUF4386 family protein [Permianibacter fluminis]
MERLVKAGACAALAQALLYLISFAVLAAFQPGDTTGWTAAQKLSYTLEHGGLTQFWALLYYASGIALVVLTAGLHQRLHSSAPVLMPLTTPFGYIWAGFVMASGMVSQIGFAAVARLHGESADQALTVWTTVKVVQDALGGGVELLGGVWVLLLSVVLLRNAARALAAFGVIVGVAGVLTVIPSLDMMKAVFGLTQIVWFIWVGFWMLRR